MSEFDYLDLSPQSAKPPVDPMAPPEAGGFWHGAGDIALAVPRGVAGAAEGLVGLGASLVGAEQPDFKEQLLGDSDTTAGRILEGITNFATGFLPVAGALGKIGQIGAVASKLAALDALGNTALSIGKGLAAGAITQFITADGHASRLSNLVQEYPSLQNPVTEFLAADPNDPQVVGRLKGALEGLGLGAATEGLFLGLKSLNIMRHALAAGATEEEAQAIAQKAVPQSELEAALNRAPEADMPQGVQGGADPAAPPPLEPVKPEPQPEAEMHAALGIDGSLRSLGADDSRVGEFKAALKHREELNPQAFGAGVRGKNGGPIITGNRSKVNPRALLPEERLALELEKGDLNLTHYAGQSGAFHLIRAAEDLGDAAWREGQSGLSPQTLMDIRNQAVNEVADLVGSSDPRSVWTTMLRQMGTEQANIDRGTSRIVMYRSMMLTYAKEMVGKLGKTGEAFTDAQRLEFARDVSTFNEIVSGVKGLTASQGRALVSNRAKVQDLSRVFNLFGDAEAHAAAVNQMGGATNLDNVMNKFRAAMGDGDVEGVSAVSKLAQASRSKRFVNVTTEYFINSILSGPRTMVVNGLSGLAMAVYHPFEQMLGSGVAAGANAAVGRTAQAALHSEQMSHAFGDLVELVRSVPDALKAGLTAFKDGENRLLTDSNILDTAGPRGQAFSPDTFGLAADSPAGQATLYIGRTIGLPTRILGATDEFTKNLVYRSTARAQIIRDAVKNGMPAEQIGAHVNDLMDRMVFNGQAYSEAQVFNRGVTEARAKGIIHPDQVEHYARAYAARPASEGGFDTSLNALSQMATKYAQDATFSTPLPPGSVGADFQAFVGRHPLMRFITPFVRTPINILNFTAQRFDAPGAARVLASHNFPEWAGNLNGSKNRFITDMLSGDARQAGDAVGRLVAGGSIGAWGISMASQGLITGRGPSDPGQRKILQDSGWLPYSIKTPDGYVSFARLDPWATMLGTMADIYDYGRFAHDDDQESGVSAFHGLAVALANNFTNKSYLTGLSNFVTMLESPDRQAGTFFQRYAGSIVPNALGQSVDVTDDNMRDVRGMVDAMIARVPGISDTLPPQRNMLGQPILRQQQAGSDAIGRIMNVILPVAYSEVSNKAVSTELAQLGHGFVPPKRVSNGIDLTTYTKGEGGQDAYDRWGELHGTVRKDGLTLEQALNRLIRSPEYQRVPLESTHAIETPRISMVNSVLQDYRRAAYAQLLREYPDLNRAERAITTQKGQLRKGVDTRFLSFGQ